MAESLLPSKGPILFHWRDVHASIEKLASMPSERWIKLIFLLQRPPLIARSPGSDHETLALALRSLKDAAMVTGKVGGATIEMANMRSEFVARPASYLHVIKLLAGFLEREDTVVSLDMKLYAILNLDLLFSSPGLEFFTHPAFYLYALESLLASGDSIDALGDAPRLILLRICTTLQEFETLLTQKAEDDRSSLGMFIRNAVSSELRVRVRLMAHVSAISHTTSEADVLSSLSQLQSSACLSIDMTAAACSLYSIRSCTHAQLPALFVSVAHLGEQLPLPDRAALITAALSLSQSVLSAVTSIADLVAFLSTTAPRRLAFIEAELAGQPHSVVQHVSLQFFALALRAVEHDVGANARASLELFADDFFPAVLKLASTWQGETQRVLVDALLAFVATALSMGAHARVLLTEGLPLLFCCSLLRRAGENASADTALRLVRHMDLFVLQHSAVGSQPLEPRWVLYVITTVLPRALDHFGDWKPSPSARLLLEHSSLDLGLLLIRSNFFSKLSFYDTVLPLLIVRVTRLEQNDEARIAVLQKIMEHSTTVSERGSNPSALLLDGLALAELLNTKHPYMSLFDVMLRRYETSQSFGTLTLLRRALEFFTANVGALSLDAIQHSFMLYTRFAMRQDVRLLARASCPRFLDARFDTIREFVLQLKGESEVKRAAAVLSVADYVLTLTTPRPVPEPRRTAPPVNAPAAAPANPGENAAVAPQPQLPVMVGNDPRPVPPAPPGEGPAPPVDPDCDDYDDTYDAALEAAINNALIRLSDHVLGLLSDEIRTGRVSTKRCEGHMSSLSRIALFRLLYQTDLVAQGERPAAELMALLEEKFPTDVLQSKEVMAQISNVTQRIQRVNAISVKRRHVATFATDLLSQFFNYQPTTATPLQERLQFLRGHLLSLPANVSDRERLVGLGYSAELFDNDVWLTMETEQRNFEEEFRLALISLFSEYAEHLLEVGETLLHVANAPVPVRGLFRSETSLAQLRERRSAAVKALNSRLGSNPLLMNKVNLLLAREQQLEAQLEKNLRSGLGERRRVTMRFMNKSFFEGCSICKHSWAGCYAVDGDHAEKPIENAVKHTAAFISLFEERKDSDRDDLPNLEELENVEVLLTDQGMYFYKLYQQSNSLDNSVIWALFLRMLMLNELIPAAIIPAGHLNPRAFSLIRRQVDEVVSSSLISYSDEFFQRNSAIESYYDNKAQKINPGDLLLTADNTLKLRPSNIKLEQVSSSHPLYLEDAQRMLRRSGVAPTQMRDWAGTVSADVLRRMRGDPELSELCNVLGRHTSQYTAQLLECATADTEILNVGLDLTIWNRRKSGKRMAEQEKQRLIGKVVALINLAIKEYMTVESVSELFVSERGHFFEMKHLLEMVKLSATQPPQFVTKECAQQLLSHMHTLLQRAIHLEELAHLTEATQAELVRWVFTNEDKVWRARGGRPGEETLAQFLALLQPHKGHPCVPGIVCFFQRPERDEAGNVRDARVCGYLVGEWVSESEYEVITTWTSPHCRGMRIALFMYELLLARLASQSRGHIPRHITCDMIEGALGSIIKASPVLGLLSRLGLLRYVVGVAPSYKTPLGNGKVERFERITLRTLPLHYAFRTVHLYHNVSRYRSWVLPLAAVSVWLGVTLSHLTM